MRSTISSEEVVLADDSNPHSPPFWWTERRNYPPCLIGVMCTRRALYPQAITAKLPRTILPGHSCQAKPFSFLLIVTEITQRVRKCINTSGCLTCLPLVTHTSFGARRKNSDLYDNQIGVWVLRQLGVEKVQHRKHTDGLQAAVVTPKMNRGVSSEMQGLVPNGTWRTEKPDVKVVSSVLSANRLVVSGPVSAAV